MTRTKQTVVADSQLKALRLAQMGLAWCKLVLRPSQARRTDSQHETRQSGDVNGVRPLKDWAAGGRGEGGDRA